VNISKTALGSLKTLIFACKTNSTTLKNATQNAPKPTILRAKIKKKFTPSPHLSPFGAYGASIFAPAALKLGAYGASLSSPPKFFFT